MTTIPRRRAGYIPLLAAAILTALMAWEVAGRPTPKDAEPFHRQAALAIDSIPIKFGSWEGSTISVPESAQALLKPNAILSRRYQNPQTNEQASLVVVQCRDTRDMAGHYPPICYPGQGWKLDVHANRVVEIPLEHVTVKAMRYEFDRSGGGFDRDRTLTVYNFFAIPGQGLPIDMEAVRAAAADYTARPFGAAQFQVVFDSRLPIADEEKVVTALLSQIEPVIILLSDPKWRSR